MKTTEYPKINTLQEAEELAKGLVLYSMKMNPENDLFDEQPEDSLFHKVYKDLCKRSGQHIGEHFASHLKDKYEITFPLN